MHWIPAGGYTYILTDWGFQGSQIWKEIKGHNSILRTYSKMAKNSLYVRYKSQTARWEEIQRLLTAILLKAIYITLWKKKQQANTCKYISQLRNPLYLSYSYSEQTHSSSERSQTEPTLVILLLRVIHLVLTLAYSVSLERRHILRVSCKKGEYNPWEIKSLLWVIFWVVKSLG